MSTPSITLVCVENRNHALAKEMVAQTTSRMDFADIVMFSNQDNLIDGAKHVAIGDTMDIQGYCDLILKGLVDHVKTDHVLIVQWDSMVYNSKRWTNAYLNYDYIGAPWPWQPTHSRVGNGGFSLRSRRLLEALQDPALVVDPTNYNSRQEDNFICLLHSEYLAQKYNIRWPDWSLAKEFSYELGDWEPDAWGFHGPWNVFRLAPKSTCELFIDNMPWADLNRDKCHHIIFETSHRNPNPEWTERLTSGLRQHKDSEFCINLLKWFEIENNPLLPQLIARLS
jgi:hypothetical protein